MGLQSVEEEKGLQPRVGAATATAQVKGAAVTAVGACHDALGTGLEAGYSCCRYKEKGLDGGPPKRRRFDAKNKNKIIELSDLEGTDRFVWFNSWTTDSTSLILVLPISSLNDRTGSMIGQQSDRSIRTRL